MHLLTRQPAVRTPIVPPRTTLLRRRDSPAWHHPFVLAGIATFLTALIAMAGVVLRIDTGRGTLVIETDDPDVEITVKQGGEQVGVIDTRTHRQITLRAGSYELELAGGKDGIRLSTDRFTLTRAGRAVVKVRLEPKEGQHHESGEGRTLTPGTGSSIDETAANPVYGLAVSPAGRLFSGGKDGILREWNLTTGQELKHWQFGGMITHVSLTPDHKCVLYGTVGGGGAGLVLFNPKTGRRLERFPGSQTWPTDAVFSPDGKRLVACGAGKRLVVWDVASGTELQSIETPQWVGHMAASANFRLALSCSQWQANAWLWDIATARAGPILRGHQGGVMSVALSGNGGQALTGSKDKTVFLWDTKTGRALRRFDGHTTAVTAVAFSPNGQCLLSGSDDRTVRLWNIKSGKEIRCFKGHKAPITQLVFTPDGRQAVSAGTDGSIRLWRLPPLSNNETSAGSLRQGRAHDE